MRNIFKLVLFAVLAAYSMRAVRAQDLAPRAYVITPLHSNAIILTYSFADGDVTLQRRAPHYGRNRETSRPDLFLLPLVELLRPFGQHCRFIALRCRALAGDIY